MALAQIVLVLQMLKFSSFSFLKEQDFVKGNETYILEYSNSQNKIFKIN